MQDLLKIGICDDEKTVYNEMRKHIVFYSEQKKIVAELKYYRSGIELIESNDIKSLDILFLDIEMPRMDGIETANMLHDEMKTCKVIMLTCKAERFKEAFKIGAFRFVTKPIEQQEVFEAIDDVRKRMLGNAEISLYRDGRIYKIQELDIVYIMADKTSTCIFTEKYDFRSDRSLAWWEQELDDRLFLRCHKGYIINLGKISQIEKEIKLVTGEIIPVARRRKSELEQRFMEYDTKYR